jgi:hypothetical protein
MKNLLYSVLAVLSFTACSTSSSNPSPNNVSSYKIGNDTYTPSAITATNAQIGGTIVAAGPHNNGTTGFTLRFAGPLPTSSGTYDIVGNPTQPNHIQVSAGIYTSGSNQTSWSSEARGATAVVTVTNSKIKVVVPQITVYELLTTDSTTVSGTIIEP